MKIYARDDQAGQENIEIIQFDDAVGIAITAKSFIRGHEYLKSGTVDFSPLEIESLIIGLQNALNQIKKKGA